MRRLAAGCMTGTSLDSLDAALVEVEGEGLSLRARFVRGVSHGLGELAPRLRALAEQHPAPAGEVAALSRDFALAHVGALRALLAGERADLVSVHGQTVHHVPPVSWQLLNPWPIVRELRTPVVFDLRGADLAAGGQGAPITPLADLLLFGDAGEARTIVNLGGFCNVTLLPARGPDTADAARLVRGMDVCACNHLLDGLSRALLGTPYDAGGACAASGAVNDRLARQCMDLLSSQAAAGRSLGTGDELPRWVAQARGAASAPDVLASACDALARVIVAACYGGGGPMPPLILAGGGVRNLFLVRSIEDHAARSVRTTAALGVPPEFREAACMGVLGALCRDRVPITLSQVTGVPSPAPLAGCWAFS